MYDFDPITIGRLEETASCPLQGETLSVTDNLSTVQRAIFEYYRRNPQFAVISYNFEGKNGIVDTVNTLCGRPFDETPTVQNVELTTYFFADYSISLLKQLEDDFEGIYNGELASVCYNNGYVKVGKTDYYSTTLVKRLLQLEALYAAKVQDGPANVKKKDFPIRNLLFREKGDFIHPKRFMNGTSGGVVICNTESGWKMLIGRRAEDLDTNPSLFSAFPNGGIEYEDLWGGGFAAAARREFKEELLVSEAADEFIESYVKTRQVLAGWNLRDGHLTFGHLFTIPSVEGYERFREIKAPNEEIDGLIEVDVFDVNEVTRYLSLDQTSGFPLGVICEGLTSFDADPRYPDLPYNITARLK